MYGDGMMWLMGKHFINDPGQSRRSVIYWDIHMWTTQWLFSIDIWWHTTILYIKKLFIKPKFISHFVFSEKGKYVTPLLRVKNFFFFICTATVIFVFLILSKYYFIFINEFKNSILDSLMVVNRVNEKNN